MSRYSVINNPTAAFLAGLLLGSFLLQFIMPAVTYGMDEEPGSTESSTEQVEATTDQEEEATAIVTGDATAGLEVELEVNVTEVDTTEASEESTGEEASVAESNSQSVSTDKPTEMKSEEATPESPVTEVAPEEVMPQLPTDSDNTTHISATNTATTTTNATTTADTGSNSAGGTSSVISTGDAIAYVDVLNVVNTQIVNSDGLIDFINDALGYKNFDLRNEFEYVYADFDTSASTPACSLGVCDDGSTTVNTDNTATIHNDVTVIAKTGENQAIGDEASITTGNAYASANVINVANTNITDSNYLLLVFNNFADYAGDIVLPNSSFFDSILSRGGGVTNVDLAVDNTAVVTNTVEVVADTGDNVAQGDMATIQTGDANAASTVRNTINQNIVGGSAFSMLIRVDGDWSGTIHGLPEGLTWQETSEGIEIVSSGQSAGSVTQNLVQSTKNTANINNNVQVFALTGDNKAGGGQASISTGNAYADSSILNIANTNVIGSNWSNLIFTIYGNWSGDLTFGQPDLWLGVSATSPDQPIMPGSAVTYTFTVFNHGDTTAPDVSLETLIEDQNLTFASSDERSTSGRNTTNRWSIGDVPAGGTREFSYTAYVRDDLPSTVVSTIPLVGRVYSTQRDANDDDNKDVVNVYVGKKRDDSVSLSPTFPTHLEVTKTASRDLAQPGDTVDYSIEIFNHGGQLYDALLVDTLEDENGEIVQQQTWPLGEIKNWESLTIKYSMAFDSSMATGTYTNYAQLVGFHGSRKTQYQSPYESPVAAHVLHLGMQPEGQVLGLQTSSCEPYITEYLRFGGDNDPGEVAKLQRFLNEELDRNLEVSGIFDTATEQAVRDFQLIHREEILLPWGLEQDSGYVYYTTQKEINEIVCGNTVSFPLSSAQQQEITAFRGYSRNAGGQAVQHIAAIIEPTKPERMVVTTPEPTVKPSNATDTSTPSFIQEDSGDGLVVKNKVWDRFRYWLRSLARLRPLE